MKTTAGFLFSRMMTKSACFLLLFCACGSAPSQQADAPVNTGEPCNAMTGQGCPCGGLFGCPVASDQCAALGKGFGSFCANACTAKTQAADCAMAPGQLGVGACVLTIQGSLGKYCAVLCGHDGQPTQDFTQCPRGFVGMTLASTGCVCVPPASPGDGGLTDGV